ncbi:hypothetical protein BKA93DRAFT_155285 [Sparassis latifolia]|uniref:G3BP-like n=1 Tax=Sparassis crispa TaxID=139825 RepID=A0A401H2U2_9APHY|nr:Putative G3BP-like [Sparassis crispa]GBE88757.1 Putative G3BP-like [Sparassis crispa]
MTNPTVNPSEVGWQFVPQYYTFVNKHPNRLHCFYTKASTFIHGTEGEDGKPCYGQQEIHNKITSIGFQDCKVFIHSVDAQSSANGGIIIQVIGEMSNHGEPWRKFVQTFFLAEQPNGYFVLNDIFRFLKEETVESDDQAEEAEDVDAAPSVAEHPVVVQAPAIPAPPPPAEPQPEPVHTPTPAPAPVKPAEEPLAPAAPQPAPEVQQPNGIHAEPTVESVPVPAPAAEGVPSASPSPEPPATASPPPVSPPAPQHKPVAASPAPPPPSHPPAPTPMQAPAAPAPAAPRSWANLAAKDSGKWGAVAQETRGISEAPVTSVSPAPLNGPQQPLPHAPARPPPHPALFAAQNVATAQCFVKSVTENISDAALKATLVQRFGPIKELEILRPKACAFLEFVHLDAARRAIAASLPIPQGGEGGVRIDLESGGFAKILVETRKERGDRPPPRGPPVNGDRGRGGYRGRGGPGNRGRGGPPPQK